MIDSWGGSRSQFLQEYLQKTTMKHGAKATVDHIHDRFPPKFMAYPRAEKFTKRAMSDADRGATLLILLTRRPAKSLSSRMYVHVSVGLTPAAPVSVGCAWLRLAHSPVRYVYIARASAFDLPRSNL